VWICLIVIPVTILWLVSVFDLIFRQHEMSGWKRVGWLVLVLVLPVIGALIYLTVHGPGQGQTDSYRDLNVARARGQLTDDQYDQQRARLDADPGARW
jgi:hypothetical protein